jgi:hypothetical protein
MSSIIPIGVLLSALATVLALNVARKRREHRPVAALLAFGLLSDLARWPLRAWVLLPAHERFGTEPLQGGARLAFHVDQALFLAYPAAVAALAIGIFLRRRPWAVAIVWAATIGVLAAMYPATRGALLRRCYLAAELASLTLAVGSFITWVWKRETPTLTHGCVMLIAGIELAMLIGPYRLNIYSDWDIAAAMYSTMYVALAILNGGASWPSSTESKSG